MKIIIINKSVRDGMSSELSLAIIVIIVTYFLSVYIWKIKHIWITIDPKNFSVQWKQSVIDKSACSSK